MSKEATAIYKCRNCSQEFVRNVPAMYTSAPGGAMVWMKNNLTEFHRCRNDDQPIGVGDLQAVFPF